jgi:hypothetical protein
MTANRSKVAQNAGAQSVGGSAGQSLRERLRQSLGPRREERRGRGELRLI